MLTNNNAKIEVIPGIFEKEWEKIEEKVRLVKPHVEWVQIDIADGKLVPNTSFCRPEPFKKLTGGKLKFELHMMVEEPWLVAERWANVGFKRMLIQIESLEQISHEAGSRFARQSSKIKPACRRGRVQSSKLQKRGIEIGIAVDASTPIDNIKPYIDILDCVLIMTVKAGFSGQAFMPAMLRKVRAIHKMRPNLPIEVDGGINNLTAKEAIKAGASRLVTTSYIFNSTNIEKTIWTLKSLNP